MIDVHFIGTSDAFGAGGRRQSAFLLREPNGNLLIDCGITTNTGLNAEGIRRDEIDAIVVSHFNADHFGGIPLLLLAACEYTLLRNRIFSPRINAPGSPSGHPTNIFKRTLQPPTCPALITGCVRESEALRSTTISSSGKVRR